MLITNELNSGKKLKLNLNVEVIFYNRKYNRKYLFFKNIYFQFYCFMCFLI